MLAHWLGGTSAVPDPSLSTGASTPASDRGNSAAPSLSEATDATAGPVDDAPTGGAASAPVQCRTTTAVATAAPISNRAGGNPYLKPRKLELEFNSPANVTSIHDGGPNPTLEEELAGEETWITFEDSIEDGPLHLNGKTLEFLRTSTMETGGLSAAPASAPAATAAPAVRAVSVTASSPALVSNGAEPALTDSRSAGSLHSQSIQRPVPSHAVYRPAHSPAGTPWMGSLTQATNPLTSSTLGSHTFQPASGQVSLTMAMPAGTALSTADKSVLADAVGSSTSPDTSPTSSHSTPWIATGQFQGTNHSHPATPSETGEPFPDNPPPTLASSVITETHEAEATFVSSDTATTCHTIRSLLTDGEQSVPTGAQDFRQGSRC